MPELAVSYNCSWEITRFRLIKRPLVKSAAFAACLGLTLCHVSPGSNAAPATGSIKGWTIQQKHAYLGDMVIHISESAIRIADRNNGVELVSSAPDWKVTVFSPERKVFYEMPYSLWDKRGLQSTWVMLTNVAEWPISEDGREIYQKIDCRRYMLSADPRAREKIKRGIPINRSFGRAGDYWIGTAFGAASKEGQILEQLYRFPRAEGIPIGLKVYHGPNQRYFGLAGKQFKRGDFTVLLETTRCIQENFPKAFFTRPPGLRRATSDSEVAISRQTKEQLDDVVRDMGLGSDLGSGK